MILVSLDGVSSRIFGAYQSGFLEKGFSCAKRLTSVFPSVTYPSHMSILTGNRPRLHGIFENKVMDNSDMSVNLLYGKCLKDLGSKMSASGIVEALEDRGKKCKMVGWPLFEDGFSYGKTMAHQSKVRIEEKRDLEKFATLCDLVKGGAKDFTAVQFLLYDCCAHIYGANSFRALEALEMLACFIEHLKVLCDEYGESMIVVSDHGMVDRLGSFFPNVWLRDKGFGDYLDNKKMRFVCDGSGAVLFYSNESKEVNRKILRLIKGHELVNDVYEVDDAGDRPFVPFGVVDLEKGVCGEDILDKKDEQYALMKALHGYNPDKVDEMNGIFMVYGKGFCKGKIFESVDILDAAPIIGEFFGFDYGCEGKGAANIFEGGFDE